MTHPSLSTFGGLKEGDLYIERPADVELLRAIERGEYTYVLASRQTGKTSLMSRTLRKLEATGTRCVKLDMGAFAFEGTADAWYLTLAREIAAWLGQPSAFAESLFLQHARRAPLHRFTRFLQAAVQLSEAPLVVFMDEVESFLKMPGPVADGFLTAIRSYVNDRDRTPLYRRLSFCLMGVCTPTELIQDERRTPFNVARGIPLEDFDWESVRAAFLPLFAERGAHAEAALQRVYHWTQGHPYLTHRLCKELLEQEGNPPLDPPAVDRVVREIFLGSLGREQENLLEVERRFAVGQPHRVQRRLALYRSLLQGEKVPARGNDPIHLELRLTGLAKEQRLPGEPTRLAVRNPIFASVFDASWLPQTQPAKLDPAIWLKEQTQRWIEFDRKDAFVLYGEELREALAWAERQPLIEPRCEEFLNASRRVNDRERALRLNSLLLTALASSSATFLLSQLIPDYWQQRAYSHGGWLKLLYGLAFVLALPSGILADRQRLESVSISIAGFGLSIAGSLLLLLDCLIKSGPLALGAVILIAIGQSVCRPHVAVLLNSLYPRADRRITRAFLILYLVVNVGALLGPMMGTSLFQTYGWIGPISAVLLGYGIAIGLLSTARHSFERTRLAHQVPPAEDAPRALPSRIAVAVGALLVFWMGFYVFDEWIRQHVSALAAYRLSATHHPGPQTSMEILLRSVSLDSVTTLFVLGIAPVFVAWHGYATRHKLRENPARTAALSLALLALLLGWLLLRPQPTSLPLGAYLVLSVAELLSVPVSMSMAALLSPPRMQCTSMGLYYFLIGIAVWVPKLWPGVASGLLVILMTASALLAGVMMRMDWRALSADPSRSGWNRAVR